jgi:MFS transporter, NNP family, nitrate/nitrite transporter
MKWKEFAQAGHLPTLFSSLFFFDVCFTIWVLAGALAPFLSEQFHMTAAQKGFMISVPILSGALLRFPMGLWAQRTGRKTVALVIMAVEVAALLYGWLLVDSYADLLVLGVLLGVAGASFGVAMSLGAGSFPAQYKGLAMGIAGAGNSGTVIAALFGPWLAKRFGWESVFGLALIPLLLAMAALIVFAKEPPDASRQSARQSLTILAEKDTWVFNFLYAITFGGFIGLTNFLPTFFHDQYGVTKVAAGQFTAAVVLMGSVMRVIGGHWSDRIGGIRALTGVLVVVTAGFVAAGFLPPLHAMTALLLLVFAALGVGNGAVFQLVPLRYPAASALASSVIGEAGALGGALIPNAMGLSLQWTHSYWLGFGLFAAATGASMVVLIRATRRWTSTWAGDGGKARVPAPEPRPRVAMAPVMETR